MVDRNRWEPPDDLPYVEERLPQGFRAHQDEDEERDWVEAVAWVADRNAELQWRTCVRLERLVNTLINGGAHLHGWDTGAGGTAPPGQGLPELVQLRTCNIDCFVHRHPINGKAGEIHVGLYTPHVSGHLGYDDEGTTRRVRTVGPRQSGPPPDMILVVGPSWVRMQPHQREAEVTNELLRITNTGALLREWIVGGLEVNLNSQTLMIYGPYNGEAVAAISAAQRHVQLPLDTPERIDQKVANLDRAEKTRILGDLARSLGLQFYRAADRAVVDLDGAVIERL